MFLVPGTPAVFCGRPARLPPDGKEEPKMFASRTIIAIPAAVIALLGCGSGTGGNAPSDTAVIGSPAPTNSINSTNWTLCGGPCALIPVPAAAPLATRSCPGVRPRALVRPDVGQCTLNFLFLRSHGASYICCP